MSDEVVPTPEPKTRRPRGQQDQEIANRLSDRMPRLLAALANAELVRFMTPRGFDAAGMGEGVTRGNDAQAAFNARAAALNAADTASRLRKAAEATARTGYAGFRKIAGGVFKTNPTARAAVTFTDRQLADQQKFLTNIDGVYNTVLTRSTYLAALGKRGYDEVGVKAELAKLKAMVQSAADSEAARQAADRTLALRNTAVQAFDDWWAELIAVAEVALKDRPDLLKMLKP